MYQFFIKRFLDIIISFFALIILSPIFLILIVLGAVVMRGNPFFFQRRPGKKDKNGVEKIFCLIKFRTMSNKKDSDGNLLPDKMRLNKYGRMLRATSLDELPELINIFKGDMSLVGPRPLVPQYLPYYTEEERHRHDVRPGLSGLAQINGRNGLQWEERFNYDIEYIRNISFLGDVKIIFLTLKKTLIKEGIVIRGTGKTIDFDVYRKAQLEQKEVKEGNF